MRILKNCWYVAGWSNEVEQGTLLPRRIADEPILFFRRQDSSLAAIADYCPHRYAPLHRGKQIGDVIQCGYHGLEFNAAGQCVRNPHQTGNLPQVSIPSYPVEDRYGAIWIWIGDAEKADASLINSEFDFLSDPARARVSGHIHVKANYQLLLDNLMDISHALYLHGPAFMTEDLYAKYDPKMKIEGDEVIVTLEQKDITPPGLFKQGLPEGTERVDFYDYVKYIAPSLISHDIAYTQLDEPPYQASGASSRAAHLFTPETDTTTHYFFCHARTFLVDSAETQEKVRVALNKAFADEDIPMIEAQQAVLGDRRLFDLKPAILVNDRAGVLVRRTLDKWIREQERGDEAPAKLSEIEVA